MTKPDPGPAFWKLIEPHTGMITRTLHTERGYSSDVTALVDCEAGELFVKAVHDTGPHTESIEREAKINPYVRSVSPALKWHLRSNGWTILAFEAIAGTHADFTPGSPDLPAIADAVDVIGAIECPKVARDWPETRWDRFTDQPSLFAGDALVYADINPGNMLVGTDGVSVVDWSWPTHGAGFIDPACLVVQLVAAGHNPAAAEQCAERCTAWQTAEPTALDAFAQATIRMYQHFETRDPAPWRTAMTTAATTWAQHRGLPAPDTPQQTTALNTA
jgi:hypothetical protein